MEARPRNLVGEPVGGCRLLGMAEGTARKHVQHVHAKLGTTGPVATVQRATRLGYLD